MDIVFLIVLLLIVAAVAWVAFRSLKYIGPTEVGLPTKRFGSSVYWHST